MSWPPQRRQWWRQAIAAAQGGAVERGYLVADGVNDYGHALTAAAGAFAAGTAGELALVLKTNNSLAVFPKVYGQIVDTAGSPSGTQESVTAAVGYSYGDTRIDTRTWDRSSGGSTMTSSLLGTAGGVTYAMCRRNGTRELRAIVARAGTTIANNAATPTIDRDAAHVVIAARVNLALTPADHSPLQWVAGVLLLRYPTADEVAAYSATDDARAVWPDAIHAYWVASDAVGTSVPARVGSVPMTLAGGWSAADLVLS